MTRTVAEMANRAGKMQTSPAQLMFFRLRPLFQGMKSSQPQLLVGLGSKMSRVGNHWAAVNQVLSPIFPLVLLAQYMPGYSVSWPGALIGAAWGFFSGFVIGWFFAFARNVVMAIAKVVLRAKAELAANRGFLDHI